MTTTSQDLCHDLVKLIRNTERRLEAAGDLDPLMDAIGDAHYALHPLHTQPLSRTPPDTYPWDIAKVHDWELCNQLSRREGTGS